MVDKADYFDFEEVLLVYPREDGGVREEKVSYKTGLKEPCADCVSQVMCIHKDWIKVLDICENIKDYIAYITRGSENLDEVHGEMADIKSIGHIFTVHATRDRKAILIGKYWSPTIKKDGYIDENQLAKEAQKYSIHPIKEK